MATPLSAEIRDPQVHRGTTPDRASAASRAVLGAAVPVEGPSSVGAQGGREPVALVLAQVSATTPGLHRARAVIDGPFGRRLGGVEWEHE